MNKDNVLGFSIGFLTGAVIGGVMALLYAPKSGKETRKIIKDKATDVVDAVKEGTGDVMDKIEEAASEAGKKGEAVIKAIKD